MHSALAYYDVKCQYTSQDYITSISKTIHSKLEVPLVQVHVHTWCQLISADMVRVSVPGLVDRVEEGRQVTSQSLTDG